MFICFSPDYFSLQGSWPDGGKQWVVGDFTGLESALQDGEDFRDGGQQCDSLCNGLGAAPYRGYLWDSN